VVEAGDPSRSACSGGRARLPVTGGARGQNLTVYTHQPATKFIAAHRLAADRRAGEILSAFWPPPAATRSAELVAPLLVALTADDRRPQNHPGARTIGRSTCLSFERRSEHRGCKCSACSTPSARQASPLPAVRGQCPQFLLVTSMGCPWRVTTDLGLRAHRVGLTLFRRPEGRDGGTAASGGSYRAQRMVYEVPDTGGCGLCRSRRRSAMARSRAARRLHGDAGPRLSRLRNGSHPRRRTRSRCPDRIPEGLVMLSRCVG